MPRGEGGGGIKTVWKRGRRMKGMPRGEGGGMKTDCRRGMSIRKNCSEERKKKFPGEEGTGGGRETAWRRVRKTAWRKGRSRRDENCLKEREEVEGGKLPGGE